MTLYTLLSVNATAPAANITKGKKKGPGVNPTSLFPSFSPSCRRFSAGVLLLVSLAQDRADAWVNQVMWVAAVSGGVFQLVIHVPAVGFERDGDSVSGQVPVSALRVFWYRRLPSSRLTRQFHSEFLSQRLGPFVQRRQ